MRVYYRPEYGLSVFGIGVKAGSIDGPSGVAHLAEHIVARRSRKHSAEEVDFIVNKYMRGLGREGKMHIDTGRVHTFFGHEDLGKREHMLICADMLARLVRDQVVDEESFDVEKAASSQECGEDLDNVSELLRDEPFRDVYGGSSLGRKIEGTESDLAGITIGDVKRFVSERYVPNNMFVVALGPERNHVDSLVKRFSDWSAGEDPDPLRLTRNYYTTLSATLSRKVIRPGLRQFYIA
jgi:predicted Zn-dependent peptidase